jgi:hypothetical protein
MYQYQLHVHLYFMPARQLGKCYNLCPPYKHTDALGTLSPHACYSPCVPFVYKHSTVVPSSLHACYTVSTMLTHAAPTPTPAAAATPTSHLLHEALEAGQPCEGDEALQVLVEYQLLRSTSRRVVERNLFGMSHQTLVCSPVGASGSRVGQHNGRGQASG